MLGSHPGARPSPTGLLAPHLSQDGSRGCREPRGQPPPWPAPPAPTPAAPSTPSSPPTWGSARAQGLSTRPLRRPHALPWTPCSHPSLHALGTLGWLLTGTEALRARAAYGPVHGEEMTGTRVAVQCHEGEARHPQEDPEVLGVGSTRCSPRGRRQVLLWEEERSALIRTPHVPPLLGKPWEGGWKGAGHAHRRPLGIVPPTGGRPGPGAAVEACRAKRLKGLGGMERRGAWTEVSRGPETHGGRSRHRDQLA